MNIDYPEVSLKEVPDEIALVLPVLGCKYNCKDCFWKEYNKKEGVYLDLPLLKSLLEKYKKDTTCVCFLGGDWEESTIIFYSDFIRILYKLKVCVYSGSNKLNKNIYNNVDYYKYGGYKKECGELDKPTTNQKFYNTKTNELLNYKFIRSIL